MEQHTLGVPCSILDTDLYKFTMQQAVFQKYSNASATYRFTLRDKTVSFSRQCVDLFRLTVAKFSTLSLTSEERSWLSQTCPYFTTEYLDYLTNYRFKPEQVSITFIPNSADHEWGQLDIEASGPWIEAILWEVPLLACLSEVYYNTVVTDWDYTQQYELAYSKAKTMIDAGCMVSEFGTRRRRTFHSQEIIVEAFKKATGDIEGPGKIIGTSNVHLARKYGFRPIGTVAHEWFMAIGALQGYANVNTVALDTWQEVYPDAMLLALSDTFSSEVFFKSFIDCPERARKWQGLRQDSGDPFAFGVRAKEVYESLGIDVRQKTIIYSDSLDVDKAIRLKRHSDILGFQSSFGIGTFLTNDFRTTSSGGKETSKPLNMVIKLFSIDSKPCVKISDDLTKNNGDPSTVEQVKRLLNLPIN